MLRRLALAGGPAPAGPRPTGLARRGLRLLSRLVPGTLLALLAVRFLRRRWGASSGSA